ncbi:hypothetical protein BOX15_Mlig026090g1, partial [Macrostomum lignano]
PSGIRKALTEAAQAGATGLALVDRDIDDLLSCPLLLTERSLFQSLTRLTLSHNRVSVLPKEIARLENLQHLNLFNNRLKLVCPEIGQLKKLYQLNLGMNRLATLPREFGQLQQLELLDLSYNNLHEGGLPAEFFSLVALRALYLGDNDFERLPAAIQSFRNLLVLSVRDNDLVELPLELGHCSGIRELHIQGNRLLLLPPEFAQLQLGSPDTVLRMGDNPWVEHIADQLALGVSHVMHYLATDAYRVQYSQLMSGSSLKYPPKASKAKKISRKTS